MTNNTNISLIIEVIVAFTGILILMSIILSYFLKRLIRSFDSLNTSVTNLNINLVKNNKDTEQLKKDITLQSVRLNNHSKTIKKHDLEIERIATVCAIAHTVAIRSISKSCFFIVLEWLFSLTLCSVISFFNCSVSLLFLTKLIFKLVTDVLSESKDLISRFRK